MLECGNANMISFFQWLFSRRKEQERTQSMDRRATIFHDAVLTLFVFAATILVSLCFTRLRDDGNSFATPVFILAVALVARFTHGYLFGILASVLGVFCVNFMFTYPIWHFDMSISGYPTTFASMLVVSICISTLTSRIKRQERLHMEMEMEKMRANLLRSVSHDLRTPLTAIAGASSVLLDDAALSDSERHALLQDIHNDACWLERITENILSITKFSGCGVKLRTEMEVVEEVVSSAIVKFRKNPGALPVSMERPQEILLAPMDATLIEQVLLNLFDNAVSHGKRTSRIRVRIAREDARVCLRVMDDGAGISAAALPHLFDGSLAAHSDSSRNMGIGLSVCQSIIRAHGGGIRGYNNPEGGACIEFWLPAGLEEQNGDIEK